MQLQSLFSVTHPPFPFHLPIQDAVFQTLWAFSGGGGLHVASIKIPDLPSPPTLQIQCLREILRDIGGRW